MKKFLNSFFESSFSTKVFTILGVMFFLLFCMCDYCHAEVKRDGNKFVQVSTRRKTETKLTIYTWEDSKTGLEYPIHITGNGRCFVNRISQKTGEPYRYYIDEEIAKTICKEMGVEYTYVKKSRTPKVK